VRQRLERVVGLDGRKEHAESGLLLRRGPDDEGKAATRGENARDLPEHGGRSRQVVDDEVRHDRVEGPVGERKDLRVAFVEREPGMTAPSRRHHRVREVDPGDRGAGLGEHRGPAAWARAQVEHARPATDAGGTGQQRDRLAGQQVERVRVALRAAAPGLVLEAADCGFIDGLFHGMPLLRRGCRRWRSWRRWR
jgi:hypothetical protein